MKTRRLALLALVLVVGPIACSSSGASSGSRARANRNSNVIEAAELRDANYTTLFDAVRTLRPTWLRVRGRGIVGIGEETLIQVYIDDVRRGSSAILARIRISSVRGMRYMNPTDAALRYGSSHREGAIWITLN